MSISIQKVTPVFALATIALCAMGGCGKRQTVIYNQPEISSGGHWETAWIDPQIVLTDTLFTLIRTEQVDSFFIDEPLSNEPLPAAVHFQVDAPQCFVAVSLVDHNRAVFLPLIAQTLSQGYYKFTLYPHRLDPAHRLRSGLFLKAFYCGKTRLEPVDFR